MFKLLKQFKKTDWLLVLLSTGFIVLQVWLDLKLPDYMSTITTLIKTPGTEIGQVWAQGGFMLLCAVSSALSSVIVGFFAAKISAGFSMRLRSNIFDKIENLSIEKIKEFSTASLITRTTNDVSQVQTFITIGLQVLIKAPILAVWAVLKILGKGWQWSLATAVSVVAILILVVILVCFALPKFKIIQKLTDKLNLVTRESLTGTRVVRAFNAENFQEAKFDKANVDVTKTQLFTQKLMAIISPFMTLVMSVLSLSIYWIGAFILNQSVLTDKLVIFSDMVVFLSYAMQVISAFIMLIMIFIILPRAVVSAKRINEVLDTKNAIIDGKVEKSKKIGNIIFKNVSFKYPGAEQYVLKDINLNIKKGETVAFIGSTGSGKSTLINLIPRFYDVSEGEILIDDVNVKDYTSKALHKKIGYISQNAVLFSDTIKNNINFGDNNANLTSIKKASKIAQAEEFIEKLDDKYEHKIEQDGKNISGGQKQRISIARALARKSEILIFDDSFSALDYKTDKALRNSLKENSKSTKLIVAQRIGTIKNADKIIVIDNGLIVGAGTHDELIKNCKVYKEIALSQLSKEELENA